MSKVTEEKETIPVGLTVWAAGNPACALCRYALGKIYLRALGVGEAELKWISGCVVPTDNPETFGSILVLGDAACFIDKSEKVPLPQTAQVAGQQGAYAARLLTRGYDMAVTPPTIPTTEDGVSADKNLAAAWLKLRGLDKAPGFSFLNLGMLAYVGGGEALSQVQVGDVPVFSYAGSVAFLLWRSVYLVKQVATRNRVLVTFDWIKSALFGRDITRL